ncbi:MAG: D-2-hydroxyacid dehydrogenase [Clostridia bacterium]|nr:D-2-hydroxyacid dehydrogenase [Clostridia bacterium]
MKLLLTDCSTLSFNNDLDLKVFKKYGDVIYNNITSYDDLLSGTYNPDIILCNKTPITRAVMQKMTNLKYIGLFATGYNNIDIDSAKEFGITVCNAGSYSTSAVAQQTFAYILSHYNSVEKFDRSVKSGDWINSPTFSMLSFPTDELMNKTIGIIGFGSIGKRVSEIAKAFQMKVLVYTRTPKNEPDVSFVSLDELYNKSDIITVHCPLNEQSKKMFNSHAFKKMKNGAFFINTARGGVIDETALFNALESGKLSGAAVDVLEYEPMRKDCILINAKNIIITPHTSWSPYETRKRLLNIVCDNIDAFLNGKPKNTVM